MESDAMQKKKGPKKRLPHHFKPGQSGNPAGKKPTPPAIKAARLLNREAFIESVRELWYMNKEELQSVITNPWQPAGKVAIASVMLHAIKFGDSARLRMILEYAIGKPKETIELTPVSSDHIAARFTDEQLDRIVLREIQLLKAPSKP